MKTTSLKYMIRKLLKSFAKRFGITAKEAGFIYEEVQMDAFR